MFYIETNIYGNYYISLNGRLWDSAIAVQLGLTVSEYRKILLNCNGGYSVDDSEEITFDNREDVELAIKALEPYLIMQELTKE